MDPNFAPQSVPTPSGTPSPSKGAPWWLVGVLVVLLLVAGYAATASYLGWWPFTSEEGITVTDDWQTISNEIYGIELRYPDSYEVITGEDGWPNALFLLYKGGQSYDIAVEVFDSYEELEMERGIEPTVIHSVGDKIIAVTDFTQDEENSLVLSTLRFTRSAPYDITESWKTYTDDNSGISFKYPYYFPEPVQVGVFSYEIGPFSEGGQYEGEDHAPYILRYSTNELRFSGYTWPNPPNVDHFAEYIRPIALNLEQGVIEGDPFISFSDTGICEFGTGLRFMDVFSPVVVTVRCGPFDEIAKGILASFTSSVDEPQSRDVTYVNEDYGFELTLPQDWSTYVEYTRYHEDVMAIVQIAYNGTAMLPDQSFDIVIYSAEQWSRELASDKPHPTVLAQTSEYVFTHSPLLDYQGLPGQNDIPDILGSFRLLSN